MLFDMDVRNPNYPGELSTDAAVAERSRNKDEICARARAIDVLQRAEVPFVVGGAYAYATYTGIHRDTKDLDLFPRKADALRALEVLEADGWQTERTDEVWLYKAFRGEWYVDLIFSSGNGVAVVDEEWFVHARSGMVFGRPCQIAPPEEVVWSKSFVLERERYDGSDVIHLVKCAGRQFDWNRLLRRFDRHWEVLLSHLLLFRFAYPCERSVVPDWVMSELMARTVDTLREGDWNEKICRGNLISRVNYGVDIASWGYLDGRSWDEAKRATKEGQEGRNGSEGGELQASSGCGW